MSALELTTNLQSTINTFSSCTTTTVVMDICTTDHHSIKTVHKQQCLKVMASVTSLIIHEFFHFFPLLYQNYSL